MIYSLNECEAGIYGKEFDKLYSEYKFVIHNYFCKIKNKLITRSGHGIHYSLIYQDDYAILIEGDNQSRIFLNDLSKFEQILKNHPDIFKQVYEINDKFTFLGSIDKHGYLRQSMVSLNYEILNLYEDVNMKMLCEDFLDSKDYLLFLLGNPGVGKSSILKYMMKYCTKFSYIKLTKEDLLNDGAINLIQDKLFDENICLFLDDVFMDLENRENNLFIEKITSLTSGIVSGNLKVIITTNQTVHNINEVLLRPGRCFDVIEMKPMSKEFALLKWKEMTNGDTSLIIESDNITQASFMEQFFLFNKPTNYRKYRSFSRSKKIGF